MDNQSNILDLSGVHSRAIGWVIVAMLLLLSIDSASGADCSVTSVGTVPLTDLGTGTYIGLQGGLYPNASNSRPAAHEAAGIIRANQIIALDSNGNPDPDGKYVLLSIGMSNATQEFRQFMTLANGESEKDSSLLIVDGAQSGQIASVNANPNSNYWSVVSSRLAAAGVTNSQVAVAWVKAGNQANTNTTEYRKQLQSDYEEIARVLHSKFPNIQLAYYSSRIYAGYATTNLNPEPYAYESGFAVRSAIESQLNGVSELNYDSTQGGVRAPWLSWGPYFWADGLNSRSDGLQWECGDLENDGTHPSAAGERKVAAMLLDFFKTDTTANLWFLADPVDIVVPAAPENLVVE